MKEIAMEQLRFTAEETKQFLQRMFRSPVDEITAALLGKKTEGWVTGLRWRRFLSAANKTWKGLWES